jgi:hypothetical protein
MADRRAIVMPSLAGRLQVGREGKVVELESQSFQFWLRCVAACGFCLRRDRAWVNRLVGPLLKWSVPSLPAVAWWLRRRILSSHLA